MGKLGRPTMAKIFVNHTRVCEELEKREIDFDELAEIIGYSKRSIHYTASKGWPWKYFSRLCAVVGISIDEGKEFLK